MTNLLYSLRIFNERLEGFFIGLFESSEKARQVAEHYLSALPGFRDYPCTYEITEKLVVGIIGQSQKVHMIWGWDEDAEGDETDVWSSACYADLSEAQRAMDEAKRRMNKQEWSLILTRSASVTGQRALHESFIQDKSDKIKIRGKIK